jgi:hypothetical protein
LSDDDRNEAIAYRVYSGRSAFKWGDFATEAEAIAQKARLVRDGWKDWDLTVETVNGPVTQTWNEMDMR